MGEFSLILFYDPGKCGNAVARYNFNHYLDMILRNLYMIPALVARGLLLMNQFYNLGGSKKYDEDLELPYLDLSRFNFYRQ